MEALWPTHVRFMGTWTMMYSRSRTVRFPTVASLLLSVTSGCELQEKWLVDDPTWPVSLLQFRCPLGSQWCWSYTTTGTSISHISSGSTLTGKLQSKEAGDLTGSKAGLCGGILRTIFHFMWVELSSKVFFWVGGTVEMWFHLVYLYFIPSVHLGFL